MGILTKEQLNERYLQIRENPYLVKYQSEPEAVQLINLVLKLMDADERDCPAEYYKLSSYQDNCVLAEALKTHIDKMIPVKKKTSDPVPRHYAIYQYINETVNDFKPDLTFEGRNKIVEFGNDYYKINGDYFYTQYHRLRKAKIKITSYLNRMDESKLKKIQIPTFAIAQTFNDKKYIEWWNLNILKKV